MSERPSLRQLEYFLAVARHLNFREAAEACLVTQPALSAQLRDLAKAREALTNEHLADALAYANRKNAGGAIFYFSRSTDLEAEVPAVRDQEGYKREITPIIIRSHSVDIGRFWLGPDALGGG